MSARNAERMAATNDRQRKKAYKAVNGYNPGKEQAVQQTIRDTIEYAERRLAEAEKERLIRRYAGFLESIKNRKSRHRWWRTTK